MFVQKSHANIEAMTLTLRELFHNNSGNPCTIYHLAIRKKSQDVILES